MASLPFRGDQREGQSFYQVLVENDAIRLILLQPSSTEDAEIRCKVVHTRLSLYELNTIDHYTALSYVWGSSTSTGTIWVDESQVAVTANLYSALRDLRDTTKMLPLWVDAICINQSNNEEKAQQISLMGRIYATATHTIIYLGAEAVNVSSL